METAPDESITAMFEAGLICAQSETEYPSSCGDASWAT